MPTSAAAPAWERYCELRSPELAHSISSLAPSLGQVSRMLWERSGEVGGSLEAPIGNLEALAGAGLYGLFAPRPEGGLGMNYDEACEVAEELAGCCATTTFIWVQHLRLLRTLLGTGTPPALVARYRAGAIRGRTKGGVVLTGLMPGPVRLRATRGDRGWALDGEAPWFSGWGIVDLVVIVARADDGAVASFLVPAALLASAKVTPLDISALRGTLTVRVVFEGLRLPPDSLLGVEAPPLAEQTATALRLNGSFPLGIARRCCALAGPSPLDRELAVARARLREADTGPSMADARAGASDLALRAAQYLAVEQGSRSAIAGSEPERLLREASLFLVFGSRPSIRDALLARSARLP